MLTFKLSFDTVRCTKLFQNYTQHLNNEEKLKKMPSTNLIWGIIVWKAEKAYRKQMSEFNETNYFYYKNILGVSKKINWINLKGFLSKLGIAATKNGLGHD